MRRSFETEIEPQNVEVEERLLNERALAARWCMSVRTLQNNRVAGAGIPYVKIGRSVRYRMSDILRLERSNVRLSTAE